MATITIICNRCNTEHHVDMAPSLATQFNAYCPNCREVVLHQTAQYKNLKEWL